MFKHEIVEEIAHQNETVLRLLRSIEQALQKRFWKMDDPILALILSVACNEPLLLIGKPGTAKSLLIRAFCETIGLIEVKDYIKKDYTKNGPLADYLIQEGQNRPSIDGAARERAKNATGYFEYLLTPFTEPNELFGYYDIKSLVRQDGDGTKGTLIRIEKDMMQNAYVVYLDEVFNASSAILNSLLTFLNEQMFHDRGERKPVLYKALFAATNRVPESGELAAVFDRFLLRCRIDNAPPLEIKDMLAKGFPETYGQSLPQNFENYKKLFSGLEHLQDSVRASSRKDLVPNPQYASQTEKHYDFYKQLTASVESARTGGFSEMSNRRLIKMMYVMLIHSMYRSVNEMGGPSYELGEPESRLMEKFFYDQSYNLHALK